MTHLLHTYLLAWYCYITSLVWFHWLSENGSNQRKSLCYRSFRLLSFLACEEASHWGLWSYRNSQRPRFSFSCLSLLAIKASHTESQWSVPVWTGNEKKAAHLWKLEGAKERLRLVEADLMEDGSFDNAIMGCHGVFHTASPVLKPTSNPEAWSHYNFFFYFWSHSMRCVTF